jgi:itaconyl-CoA hydratase
MNTHPLNFDYEQAKKTEFKKPLGNFRLTFAILVGMSFSDCSQKAVANLGWTDIMMTHPMFCGGALYDASEVISKRDSEKRPTQGLVTVGTTGKDQDGVVVCTFECTMLIWKTGHGPGDD